MLKRGDTVRLTQKALACGVGTQSKRDRTGMVIRIGSRVWVRWAGNVSSSSYHPDFIERVPDDAPLQPEIVARFSHVEITPGVVDLDADAASDPTSNARSSGRDL